MQRVHKHLRKSDIPAILVIAFTVGITCASVFAAFAK